MSSAMIEGRKWLAAIVLPGLAYWLALPFGQTPALVALVFAFTVVSWITELLPLAATALLSSVLLVLVAGQEEKKVFSAYGNPIILLFIGSFILAKSMEESGLAARFAYTILSQKWASRTAGTLIFVLGLVSCIISLIVSNTATTAMMLPIGLATLRAVGGDARNLGIAVMLMLTWGSSVAVGIPVGTPPNLIGISALEKAAEVKISFLQWAGFGMPITILMLAAAWLILRVLYLRNAPDTSHARDIALDHLRELGAMTRAEKIVTFAFLLAFTLWVAPDISGLILGKEHMIAAWIKGHITEAGAALLAATLLFVLPTDKTGGKAMTWKSAATIEWGTILLFAGGIALGTAIGDSGLAQKLGEASVAATGIKSLWALTALCTLLAILLSEMASNTAAATIMAPLAVSLAQGAGVSPVAPVLGVALGASLGFMLPVSTAPNAIVFASGCVPSSDMLKAGVWVDIAGFIAIMLGLMIFLPMLGLA